MHVFYNYYESLTYQRQRIFHSMIVERKSIKGALTTRLKTM